MYKRSASTPRAYGKTNPEKCIKKLLQVTKKVTVKTSSEFYDFYCEPYSLDILKALRRVTNKCTQINKCFQDPNYLAITCQLSERNNSRIKTTLEKKLYTGAHPTAWAPSLQYLYKNNRRNSRSSLGVALSSKFHKLVLELQFYQYIKEKVSILSTDAWKKHLGRKTPLST